MNKKTRRLSLNRETLRNLQGNDMKGIGGGLATRSCPETCTCNFTCEFTCTLTDSGCPSRYTDCC